MKTNFGVFGYDGTILVDHCKYDCTNNKDSCLTPSSNKIVKMIVIGVHT